MVCLVQLHLGQMEQELNTQVGHTFTLTLYGHEV